MTDSHDAFLLVSFGGPEGPDDVMPFLTNVTRGRGVPPERLEQVSHHYHALGGVSPINAQNRRLATAIQSELDARGMALPVYWGNRNWDPYLVDALRQIRADGHRRVLAFMTSAYSSYSSCRQYREDLADALAASGLAGELMIDRVRQFFDHPGFVTPFAEGLAAALRRLVGDGVASNETRVLFSTHSIPTAMAATSGPPGRFGPGGAYVAQHQAAMACVVGAVRAMGVDVATASLVYQSRSGSPNVPWLEPDINAAIRSAHADGIRAVVIVPIGFVSDHVEVIWDLDRDARATCEELDVRMIRVATPGTHPAFVTAIGDLVEESLSGRPATALSDLGPWPAVCSTGCCRNARADLPTVCGLDSIVGHPSRP